MGNRKRYAKFQENLFGYNEIKSIFCPPLFRKRPIHIYCKVKCIPFFQPFKDYLPLLFHGFRNKYLIEISLDNMLYFHNLLHKF